MSMKDLFLKNIYSNADEFYSELCKKYSITGSEVEEAKLYYKYTSYLDVSEKDSSSLPLFNDEYILNRFIADFYNMAKRTCVIDDVNIFSVKIEFIPLDNGGIFASFVLPEETIITCFSTNGSEQEMDPVSAGLFVTQMILSRMSADLPEERGEVYSSIYYKNKKLEAGFRGDLPIKLYKLLD